MKYILLMSSAATGVDSYRAWSQKEREMHMAALGALAKELTESGEFVATQGLAEPGEAKVVRGEKDGMPVTDGAYSLNPAGALLEKTKPEAETLNQALPTRTWLLMSVMAALPANGSPGFGRATRPAIVKVLSTSRCSSITTRCV